MAGSLLNLGGFVQTADPCQFFLSAAANSTTGGSPLFDPGALGKYLVVQGNPASIPYTGGLAKTGTRVYQLVKLDPAATATFGNVVVWKDFSDYLVTTVNTNSRQNQTAGLIVSGSVTAAGTVTSKTIDSTNGNYIFMAVEGIFPFQNENGTAVTADNLIYNGVTTAGRLNNGANYVTAVTTVVVGQAITAKASAHQGITTTGDYAHGYFHFPKLVSF